ncbi:MAG: acyl-CoA thioesterase domain-containing protein [Myxococcota bacterium]|nr:acyl-CoA thioesterase domain-containing protein [Myxococcota bacterium]
MSNRPLHNHPFGHSILQLEAKENDLLHGAPYDMGWGRLYGGHLVAQALYALYLAFPNPLALSSFHAYFLHVGNTKHTIEYKPRKLRIGHRFSSFNIQAKQNHRQIFEMLASISEPRISPVHQREPPRVPNPEACESDQAMLEELIHRFPHSKGLHRFVSRRLQSNNGLEIRPISPYNFLYSQQTDTKRLLWFRMQSFQDQYLLRILLAYVSDFLIVGTSLQPHQLSVLTPKLKFVSLDHSMWFHRDLPIDEWLLLEAESTNLHGGRCLVQGYFFTQEGELVASCTQEALVQA